MRLVFHTQGVISAKLNTMLMRLIKKAATFDVQSQRLLLSHCHCFVIILEAVSKWKKVFINWFFIS